MAFRYNIIRKHDIDNAPGICVSLFVQGCSHHCDGCFNPETWDFNGGEIFNRRIEYQFIDLCKKEYISNICILGGEPLDQGMDMFWFIEHLKSEVKKPIWMWTGYNFDELNLSKGLNNENDTRLKIACLVDFLIDGEFVKELADKNLRFAGSKNQRVIDIKQTLKEGSIILRKD